MRQHTVTIDILDKSYQVACEPEQEEELRQAARDLDDQMRAIRSTGKVIGLERVAIMAALNLSHQVLALKSSAIPTASVRNFLIPLARVGYTQA
jgi:cell division protein ZapA